MGRRTGQSARSADCPGTRIQGRAGAWKRQFDQQPDSAVSQAETTTHGDANLTMKNQSEATPDIVSLADEEGVKQVLAQSILGLWDLVNNLTRLRPSRRDRYRVTI